MVNEPTHHSDKIPAQAWVDEFYDTTALGILIDDAGDKETRIKARFKEFFFSQELVMGKVTFYSGVA